MDSEEELKKEKKLARMFDQLERRHKEELKQTQQAIDFLIALPAAENEAETANIVDYIKSSQAKVALNQMLVLIAKELEG